MRFRDARKRAANGAQIEFARQEAVRLVKISLGGRRVDGRRFKRHLAFVCFALDANEISIAFTGIILSPSPPLNVLVRIQYHAESFQTKPFS